MRDKDEMMFMDDATEGGGGGGEPSQGMAVFEGEGTETTTAQPEAEPQKDAEPQRESAPSFVDARQLASEFGHVIGQHFQPPPKEMTVEEAKKLLQVWEPSPEWLTKYDNLETRAQAIAEQRDGLIKQADTIMRYRMSEMQQAMEQRYAPVVQYMQQMEAQAGEQRFAQTYPQLNNPALRPLLFSVAQSLLASGAQFRSERELFTTLAKGVESVIKVSNPQFSLGSNNDANSGQPVSAGRKPAVAGAIPVTTPGGGGGAGQKGSSAPKPRGLAIFD